MILYTIFNIFLLIATVFAELYTSLILLKTVIGADRDIPIMINDYVRKELEKLDYLKSVFFALTTDPNRSEAKDNLWRYEYLFENDGIQHIDMLRDIPPLNNVRNKNDFDEGAWLMYEALCRQEMPFDIKAQSRLYCHYKMDRPYLRLAPFKVEIVRLNSLVVLVHEIVSDEEAQIIKMLAVPKVSFVLFVF
ncbi:hypothetical protein X798_07081 [Onchocerca flexuosa]|uniref:Uncharacterized protein n=1 Tax=Onchocerca flexuosa TaxID=387005 RepID=A0A238BKK4_9BILA|nr:hypothetical protein X798_07081 [Onchocerca flexuosa]